MRATTAWHPRHRIVHADHAAAYFRIRPDRWQGQRLRPPAPTWGVEDEDGFGTAARALTEAGLRVEAWLVLIALTLVREVCDQYDVPGLMLEACGWLGFEHGSQHEKTAGARLSACARDLLSICLCPACSQGLDLDVERLALDIRTAVDGELQRGVRAGATLGEAIGPDRTRAVHRHRAAVISDLVRDI
ncbi:MAG: hypothetical protein ACRDPR_10430, partial [Nocardioidaceae bacterium]